MARPLRCPSHWFFFLNADKSIVTGYFSSEFRKGHATKEGEKRYHLKLIPEILP